MDCQWRASTVTSSLGEFPISSVFRMDRRGYWASYWASLLCDIGIDISSYYLRRVTISVYKYYIYYFCILYYMAVSNYMSLFIMHKSRTWCSGILSLGLMDFAMATGILLVIWTRVLHQFEYRVPRRLCSSNEIELIWAKTGDWTDNKANAAIAAIINTFDL